MITQILLGAATVVLGFMISAIFLHIGITGIQSKDRLLAKAGWVFLGLGLFSALAFAALSSGIFLYPRFTQ